MTDRGGSTRSPWAVFALVGGAMVVGTLNYSLIYVAFPELQASFDASPSSVSWVVTAFSITVAALTVPSGWLADRLGRKRQFLVGVSVFAVGSTLVAVAPGLGFLIGARIVQAAGLALEAPAAQAIVLAAFPQERRSTAVGAVGAVGGVFSALGPVVGGALIDNVGWRWTFFATVPISAATVVLGVRRLPPDSPVDQVRRRLPDLPGVLLLVAGVTLLALGIVEGRSWGWGGIRTWLVLGVAVAALCTLVRRSRRHPDPILDLSLWRNRRFRSGTILGLVVAGHFGSVYLTSLTLMTQVWGMSRFRGGLAVGLIPAIAGPLTFAAGRWSDRHGHRRVMLPGLVLFVVAGGFLTAMVGGDRAIWSVWVPGAILYAGGVGLAHATSQSVALAEIDAARLGQAGATSRIFTDVGNTIWVAVAVALMGPAPVGSDDIRRVYATMIVVGLVGLPLVARLSPRPRSRPG